MSVRTGVYGGTFNPVHQSHVRLALAFKDALKLDKLFVIPAYDPPHKTAPELVSGVHRLEMCRLAFGDEAQVLDMEIRRKGRSYTVDTMIELEKQYPQCSFYFLMGSDMFLTVQKWERWQELLKLAVLCAAARHVSEETALLAQKKYLEEQGARCILLPLPPVELSSSEIRTALHKGEIPDSDKLPEPVFQYISAHGLYTATPNNHDCH